MLRSTPASPLTPFPPRPFRSSSSNPPSYLPTTPASASCVAVTDDATELEDEDDELAEGWALDGCWAEVEEELMLIPASFMSP